jgi:hypothetical protein
VVFRADRQALKSSRHSYAAVVDRFLDVKLPKEYGASDWGSMMLTAAQLQYARDDARYLHRLTLTLESELAQDDLTHVFEIVLSSPGSKPRPEVKAKCPPEANIVYTAQRAGASSTMRPAGMSMAATSNRPKSWRANLPRARAHSPTP